MLLDELERRERLEAQKRSNSSCACSCTWSLNENSSSSVTRLSWSARAARTTIAKASASVRNWSVSLRGLAERPTPSARTSGGAAVTRVVAAGSQGSEEEFMDKPHQRQQPLGPTEDHSESDEHPSVCGARAAHLRTTPQTA